MEGAIAATSNWAALYFISFNLVCVVCVMNVLVAFLLDAYQSREEVDTKLQSRRSDGSDVYLEGVSGQFAPTLPKWHREIIKAGLKHDTNIKMWKLRIFKSTGELYGNLYANDEGGP